MQDIVDACQEFELFYPEIKNPDEVYSKCDYYNKFFCEAYASKFQGKLLYLLGHRSEFKNRHPKNCKDPNPNINYIHCVCLLNNNYVVDVTHKQIDIYGPSFIYSPLDEIQKEWLITCHDIIFIFDFLAVNPFRPDNLDDIKKSHNSYILTSRRIADGSLIFTGTEENNIHLYNMNNKYQHMFANKAICNIGAFQDESICR